jgi:type II pantothenate kinase
MNKIQVHNKLSHPFIITNVGSGVSIIKVDNMSNTRISGTSSGGATFLGLCQLLTGCNDFHEG